MARSASLVLLICTASFAAAVGCGGVSTPQGATASPTPNGTHTPNPGTPTPTGTTTGSTPTPTPIASGTPDPQSATCSFVWMNDYSNFDSTIDFYEVDVAGAQWSPATNAFDGNNVVGYFVQGYNSTDGSIYDAGLANAGSIALDVTTMTAGDAASFMDQGNKTYYDAYDYFEGNSDTLGDAIATGGNGSYTGNLSDPNAQAPDPGTGTITVSGNDPANPVTVIFGDPNNTDAPATDFAVCGS